MISERCGACNPPFGWGTGPGLIVRNEYAPVLKSLAASPEARERGIERHVVAVVGSVVIATGRVRLPQLDERILDVLAIAVVHETLDPNALADRLRGGEDVVAFAADPHREVGADGL